MDSAQNSPNQSPAKPKNAKNPITSVTVVTNTEEAIAGSTFNLLRASGIKIPAIPKSHMGLRSWIKTLSFISLI